MLRRAVVILAALVLAGCSAHPLPEDVTGLDSAAIVAKIRCEFRDAIRFHVINVLLGRNPQGQFPDQIDLARKYARPGADWSKAVVDIKRHRISQDARRLFDRYDGGIIAYEFNFNMSEENLNTAGFELLQAASYGALSGGASGSSRLNRNNTRNFQITDNFEVLATSVPDAYCGQPQINAAAMPEDQTSRIAYPIVGGLGLKELMTTFLHLELEGNLSGLSRDDSPIALLPTIAENLTFTTVFSGKAGVTFAGINDGRTVLRLSKAGLETTNTRQDVHTLRLIIKLPFDDKEKTRELVAQRLRAAFLPLPRTDKVSDFVRRSALLELATAPQKEYLETKIQVGQTLGRLLPE